MKKIIFFILVYLLLPFTAFAEKTYLFEDFYYGMTKKEVKEIEKLTETKDLSTYISEKYFYIKEYNFAKFFSFDKKNRLISVSLMYDISSAPIKSGISKEEYINYITMEYINTFSTRFLHITGSGFYQNIDRQTFSNAIINKFYFYYALGKDTFLTINKKSDGTLKNFIQNIKPNNRIIEVYLFDNYLSIEFKLFKDTYKEGEPLFIAIEKINRSRQ